MQQISKRKLLWWSTWTSSQYHNKTFMSMRSQRVLSFLLLRMAIRVFFKIANLMLFMTKAMPPCVFQLSFHQFLIDLDRFFFIPSLVNTRRYNEDFSLPTDLFVSILCFFHDVGRSMKVASWTGLRAWMGKNYIILILLLINPQTLCRIQKLQGQPLPLYVSSFVGRNVIRFEILNSMKSLSYMSIAQ